MATTAGALSKVNVTSTTAQLSSAAATGGTGPYTYQWYRSTVSGFTPGGGNIISGATALTLNDSGLVPNTTYYYEVIATDSGAVAGNSAQLAVATLGASQSQNAFAQSPTLGQIDLKFGGRIVSAQIDSSQVALLFPGSAVKVVNSTDGVPKVIACAANSDSCFGYIVYNFKDVSYSAGQACEIAQEHFMYLYSTAAIARGSRVQLNATTNGGVDPYVGSSGANIVGWAYDEAPAAGSLIRVHLSVPSFLTA